MHHHTPPPSGGARPVTVPEHTAAQALLADHPTLTTESVDITRVAGLGDAALIQVRDQAALRDWARALDTQAAFTGLSSYGTDQPQTDGLPDWLWWRLLWIDTTVDQVPVRIWTMQTSTHPRTLAVQLAARIPARVARPEPGQVNV